MGRCGISEGLRSAAELWCTFIAEMRVFIAKAEAAGQSFGNKHP